MIQVVEPKEGKDASDHLAAGLTLEEFVPVELDNEPDIEVGPSRAPRKFPLTDSGNGELIAALNGERLRYDHKRKRWLFFGPHHWHEDNLDGVRQAAKDAARIKYVDALNSTDEIERKAVSKWALKSESREKIDSALTMARSEAPIADAGEGWDANPYDVGVSNGVIDLRTGKPRDGRRQDRITMVTPVAFDPDARAPRFERFLSEVFGGDEEMIGFVRRAAGYSLTGDTCEQCLLICYGLGANGKTTLLRALRETFGPYGADTPFTTLELHARTQIPEDVAALCGKRLVTASETSATSRLNETRIKALTGGDDVTACFKYGHLFTYRPTYKLWLATNHKPRVADSSHAFWRRVRLIPFLRQFDPAAEPDLEMKLRGERAGILAWAVRGALEWQERGLAPPKTVTSATEGYRAESDPLVDFLADCTVADAAGRVRATEMYAAYSRWALRNGLRDKERLGSRTFGEEMSGRFTRAKDRAGRWYEGITLTSEVGL